MLNTKDILLELLKGSLKPLRYLFINQTLNHKGTSHFWGNILVFVSRTEMLQIKPDGNLQDRTKKYPVVYALHFFAGSITIGTTLMKKDK